ncbi:MAG TPA: hypothetical protein VGN70_01785 [Gammaproteobacteria bacterium]|jgi:hypothetical protein
MRYRILIAVLVAWALGACSGPDRDAPLFSVAALPTSTKYAILVVYRQHVTPISSVANAMSSERRVALLVNGAESMSLHADAFTLIFAKPGHVRLESKWGFGLILNPTGFADLDVQAGKVYYFQVAPDDEPEPSPDVQVAQDAPAGTWLVDGNKVWITGKWLLPEDETIATSELQYCCRYMPVDDDYKPVDYTGPSD